MIAKYRVRPGQQLAHNGKVLFGGETLDLPQHLALEVRHLVDPVGADGKVKPWPTDPVAALAAELSTAKPHERISILQQHRARATSHLDDIDREIAAEEMRLAADDVEREKAAKKK